ncbi:MAG TPA: hypothetical protein VH561_00955 [Micromonosporaceae bacterium]
MQNARTPDLDTYADVKAVRTNASTVPDLDFAGPAPFTVTPGLAGGTVDLTLYGRRGSLIATATFTVEQVRELQRLLGVALYLDEHRPGGAQ